MAKAALLAWMSPVSPERDAELNEWYDSVHMPGVCAAIPEITKVTRYRVVDVTGQSETIKYYNIYDLDTDDVASAAAALGKASQEGSLGHTEAMDVSENLPGAVWIEKVGESAPH